MKLFSSVFTYLILFSFTSFGQYYPEYEWQRRPAKSVRMDQFLLDSAVSVAARNENSISRDLRIAIIDAFSSEPDFEILGKTRERGEPSGLIIKDGYIVAEWGDINRVDMTFSVAKSYLSTVAGLALDQNLIHNIDDKVAKYVWDGTFDGVHNQKISWDHLLTQSSDWSGQQFGLYDWADRPPKEGGVDDWKARELHEPGTHYKYNDVRVNVLAYSLLQVWRKSLPQVLKEEIMDPIGASTTWRWLGYHNSYVNVDGLQVQSVSGGGHFGGGIFISTLDHARFGLLFLRNGKWKEKQLISEEWVESVQLSSQVKSDYGYLWWNNSQESWEGVSREVYYAAGFGGNYIIIDNANDLVVVTRWIDNSKIDDVMRLVQRSIK
ncbi:serine hydrolase [Marivirga tractuosa]|uniref:Beta-lactamase n=1 Tax=Marivirga tractuosa (strain ATCC 23168 / DSM 4126 / NBRC 15989 / NCIMB 1408 / VKM B-1430 / H-43) TaxID=643867 RepID=E4TPC2_MARTH|nr:serine hydrolase [Marivirga tractuosa]ADR21510.1 beta-lactamase [Marivirga tractuosa DSM 4126]BDD14036.1 serine hydrolase [Marivirga tractuosa]